MNRVRFTNIEFEESLEKSNDNCGNLRLETHIALNFQFGFSIQVWKVCSYQYLGILLDKNVIEPCLFDTFLLNIKYSENAPKWGLSVD